MPILASPPFAVAEAVQSWLSFGVVWHGCDRSTWDLVDPDNGVVLSPDGTKGFGMPTFDRYTTTSPSLAGSTYTGTRTQERSWLWPIFIYGDNTFEWLQRDAAFFASMRPDAVGTLELVRPDGSSRFLDLRFVDDNGQVFGRDPAQQGWSVYPINMVAEQPYWYGLPESRTFNPPSSADFFLASGGVFLISPGGSTAEAVIPNQGDVDAWPTWVVTGAHSGATLGAGDGSVVLPAMIDGDTWTVETRPDRQIAYDQNGVDQTSTVTWNPTPVPRGSEVELSLSLTSPGDNASISCTLQPLYFRAW